MAISALAAVGSSIAQSSLNFLGNKYLQKRNFDFQERMSNTQYQRAMADMEQAGLNPMLVSKLGGSSVPSGSSASFSSADFLSSARQAKRLDAEVELLEQQKKTSRSEEYKNTMQGDLNNNMRDKVISETANAVAQREVIVNSAKNLHLTNKTGEAKLIGILNEADIDSTKAGEVLRWINRVSEALQGARVGRPSSSRPSSRSSNSYKRSTKK